MRAFQFRLERVLALRRAELAMEESRCREQAAVLERLDRERADLEARGIRAEIEVRRRSPVDAVDLAALGRFREAVQARERRLAAERVECRQRLAAQRAKMLEARRRCRLLERLRERRLAEWHTELHRETEQFAGEAFLARWTREKPAPDEHRH